MQNESDQSLSISDYNALVHWKKYAAYAIVYEQVNADETLQVIEIESATVRKWQKYDRWCRYPITTGRKRECFGLRSFWRLIAADR